MPLVLNGATSGSTTVQATDAVTATLTLPATTGTLAVNGPAFSAYSNTLQAITAGAFTKVLFDTELFDTNNNFASSRFTPTVAGYYQCNWGAGSSVVQTARLFSSLMKNGTEVLRGSDVPINTWSNIGTGLVYCNGTTDYLEVYVYFATSANTGASQATCFFNGALVRTA